MSLCRNEGAGDPVRGVGTQLKRGVFGGEAQDCLCRALPCLCELAQVTHSPRLRSVRLPPAPVWNLKLNAAVYTGHKNAV